MMGISFFSKSPKFLEFFKKQNELISQAIDILADLFKNFENVATKCAAIATLESAGNEISDNLIRELSKALVTSLDREDIHAINIAHEDLLNSIKTISSRVGLYKSEAIQKASIELIDYLKEMVEETNKMLKCIELKKSTDDHHANIRNMKSKTDLLMLVALGELFEREANDHKKIINVMIWTQIYDKIERALDIAETLSNALECASLKNG